VKIYRDKDADLAVLAGRTVAVIGYGNQGHAQALNLRDSGVSVIVGGIEDEYARRARDDGFTVVPIAEAVTKGNILPLLVPDEVQRHVYAESIASHLSPGKTLCFAHGFNINFGLIQPPAQVDVVMVAPRMIGSAVRQRFLDGVGSPAYVGVWQDASGQAWPTALALARGIGATRAGAIETTFAQETEVDLFLEQATWAAISRALILSFEVLVEEGFDPEMAALELYGSHEAAEVLHAMAEQGFFRQMHLHSRTSQYGTLSRGPRVLPDSMKRTFRRVLEEIRSGRFAREWRNEQEAGYPNFRRLWEQAEAHPMNAAEEPGRRLFPAPPTPEA
jgi:ketol-acid reductoisomerase